MLKLKNMKRKKKEIEQVWTPIITAAYQGQGGQQQGGMPDMSGMPNYGNNEGPQIDEVD
jgi:hypothetical protein